MLKRIFFLAALLAAVGAFAQNAKKILDDSYAKCREIKSGNYEMIYRWKALSGKDTLIRNYTVDFENLKDDSIYGKKFRLTQTQIYEGKDNTYATWYTGNEEISLSPKDSTATITSKSLYGNDIKMYVHNRIFFSPFTSPENFFRTSLKDDSSATFSFLGYQMMMGKPCAKVRRYSDSRPDNDFKIFNVVYLIWIDSVSNIPLRFDFDLDAIMAADTMHQHMSYEIKQYALNTVFDSNYFSLEAIPKFYKLKDYVPYKQPELLTEGTTAPAWNLTSLEGKKYSIKDFTGKILLLDFFYKSCYPCMKALSVLQSSHEKYKDQGLAVIGLDPYDDVIEGAMKTFLDKRGITYLTLYGAKETATEYKVSGYPTLYFIGKDGKVLSTEVGYGEDSEKRLTKSIEEYLQ